jgi:hypothetical protein
MHDHLSQVRMLSLPDDDPDLPLLCIVCFEDAVTIGRRFVVHRASADDSSGYPAEDDCKQCFRWPVLNLYKSRNSANWLSI